MTGLDPEPFITARSTPPSSRSGISGAPSRRTSSAPQVSGSSPTRTTPAASAISSKTSWACPAPSPSAARRHQARQRRGARSDQRDAAAGDVRQLQRAHVPGGGRRPRRLHPGVVSRRDHPSPHRHALHGLLRRDLPRPGSLQRAVRCAVPHPAARHGPGPGRCDAGAPRSRSSPGTPMHGSCSTAIVEASRCWCGFPPPSGCATQPNASAARGRRPFTAARSPVANRAARDMACIRRRCPRWSARTPGVRDSA